MLSSNLTQSRNQELKVTMMMMLMMMNVDADDVK